MSGPPQAPGPHTKLTISKAIAVGWLVVNIPTLVIMLGFLVIGFTFMPQVWWIFFLAGFILGWVWWSQSVPRWRRWAHRRGVNPDRLQQWAVTAGLVWRKGSLFEKTEARLKD